MKNLVSCKACGKEIAKGAKCPECGHDNRSFFSKHKILTVIAALFIIGVIGASTSKGSTATTATTPAATTSDTTTATTTPTPTPEPATPAVPTEYTSALASAKTYGTTMNMSKAGIYDQLISSAGDKFSPQAAQYAVDNVSIDWNANALASAKTYQSSMNMSPTAVYDQLISSAGDKFTPSQAQYAKDNLK